VGAECTGIDDHVVAFAVAMGLGDAESTADRFEGESEFGELSAALGGEFTIVGGIERG
jgi:hypothetical protein